MLFVISILAYKFNIMLRREQTTVKKNTLVSLSNDYQPPENLYQKGWNMAFMVSDYYATGSLYDER